MNKKINKIKIHHSRSISLDNLDMFMLMVKEKKILMNQVSDDMIAAGKSSFLTSLLSVAVMPLQCSFYVFGDRLHYFVYVYVSVSVVSVVECVTVKLCKIIDGPPQHQLL